MSDGGAHPYRIVETYTGATEVAGPGSAVSVGNGVEAHYILR